MPPQQLLPGVTQAACSGDRSHTEQVSLGACNVPRCRHPASALQWICQYGQHLTSLKLDAGVTHALTVTQLPCSNLSELVVASGRIQLGPTPDGQPGVIPSLTALMRLELCSCKCADAPAGGVLDCFSSLARLQHLDVHLRGEGSPLVDSVFCLSDATLLRLQQLTYLSVSELYVDNLLQLGGLSELQQLHVSGCEVVVGPNSPPGLALPASLTCLKLYFPAVADAGFLSVVPVGLQELLLDCHMEGAAATLLCGVARLQSLTSLFLMNGGGLVWPPPGPAYSALTASSRLGRLGLRSIKLEGAWPHILPAKRQLPFLTALHMPAGAVDLPTLVSCCLSLCCAGTLSLEHGAHVSELRNLSALTCLRCRYEPAGLDTLTQSMQGLAAVQQLRDLAIYVGGSPILVAGLLPLTSLTALTHFTCDCTSASDSDADDDTQQEAVSFLTYTTTTQVRAQRASVADGTAQAWDMPQHTSPGSCIICAKAHSSCSSCNVLGQSQQRGWGCGLRSSGWSLCVLLRMWECSNIPGCVC